MKLDHVERPLRGARQEPAVEFGNVFRCQANVKRGSVLRYRDGIDFARKAIVEGLTSRSSRKTKTALPDRGSSARLCRLILALRPPARCCRGCV
jgi:hypothetical protein